MDVKGKVLTTLYKSKLRNGPKRFRAKNFLFIAKFKKLGFTVTLKSWFSQLSCLTFSVKGVV